MVYPLLPKCSNFQITEFSPALETDFESIFVSGGYNQRGRGLDHFASEPFVIMTTMTWLLMVRGGGVWGL